MPILTSNQMSPKMSNQNDKPDILVSTYGNRPPKAAEFGKGVSDVAGVTEATDARRNVPPGVFDHKR
jgi:hypothetical protein